MYVYVEFIHICVYIYLYVYICKYMYICKFSLSLTHTAYLVTWYRNPNTHQLAKLTWKCRPLLKCWETGKRYFAKLSWMYKASLTLSQALLDLWAFSFLFLFLILDSADRRLQFPKLSLNLNPQGLENKYRPDGLDLFSFN